LSSGIVAVCRRHIVNILDTPDVVKAIDTKGLPLEYRCGSRGLLTLLAVRGIELDENGRDGFLKIADAALQGGNDIVLRNIEDVVALGLRFVPHSRLVHDAGKVVVRKPFRPERVEDFV
jgi:hypothetical protein